MTPPLAFGVLFCAGVIGVIRELFVVLGDVYLVSRAPLWTSLCAMLVGALAARRFHLGTRAFSWLLFGLSIVAAASAPVAFLLFGHSGPLGLVLVSFAVLGGALSGVLLHCVWSFLGHTLVALGAFARVLNPFRLLGFALVCALAAGVSSMVGSLRTTAALGIVFATLGFWCAPLHAFLERRPLPAEKAVRWVGIVLILCELPLFVLYEQLLPAGELGIHGNPTVYREVGTRQRFTVTSGQDALELWVDGRLVVSTIDEARYSEALVHPALVLAPRRRRVLLLGSGFGPVEREILRHEDVEHITLVVLDRRSVELGRRLSWLRERSQGALASPKLHIVEAEAAVWLEDTAAVFDVAIVDLPDPHDYVEGKNYTRWFYASLFRHLTVDGVLAVQATSVFSTPRTFRSIRLTLDAAGFSTLAYHAPIPTMGDWGFVLGFRGAPVEASELVRVKPYLSGASVAELGALPRDSASREGGLVSSLDDQQIVEVFGEERP